MNRPWEIKFNISNSVKNAVYIQIVEAIISAIKEKRLLPNEILPSSRKLAESIGVNRNTLIKALDILIAEGWLVSKERSGVYVADIKILKSNVNLDSEIVQKLPKKPFIHLDDGVPNTEIAPIKELASAYRRAFGLISKYNSLGYSNSLGTIKFRQVISQMLNHERGMKTVAQDICITRGSQMALYLISHCLLESTDSILVENPGYQPAWNAFKSKGVTVIPVDVDDAGLDVKEVEYQLSINKNIKAIYVTPHHQYPTTVTLSLKRRLKLIELSNHYNFMIIEDDYDNEFHFDKRPIMPLSSYSNAENCIYIGTFSKIVAPSLRIGYIHTNSGLIEKIGKLRQIIDVQNDLIMESSLIELIKNGDIKRHVRRATRYYLDKKNYFESLLNTYLKDWVTFHSPIGGLAFWIKPIEKININILMKYLEGFDIEIVDSSKYSFDKPVNGFRVGYGNVSKKNLEKVVMQIAEFYKIKK